MREREREGGRERGQATQGQGRKSSGAVVVVVVAPVVAAAALSQLLVVAAGLDEKAGATTSQTTDRCITISGYNDPSRVGTQNHVCRWNKRDRQASDWLAQCEEELDTA